jgi:hypothetical protein
VSVPGATRLLPGRRLRVSEPVAVALLAAAVLALQLAWIVRVRWGFPTEWDESGYIAVGIRDLDALRSGGPVELARTYVGQGGPAPLVPLAAVPALLLAGRGIDAALLVVPCFLALLVVATYGLARFLLPRGWALLAATLVGTTPAVQDWGRTFHFSVPAAALAAAALWALLASDGLRSRRLALLGGALVGAMLLARTMTVAYVPAFLVAAGLQAGFPDGARRRRLVNLGLAATAAVLVAATWYAHNWRSVVDYLVGSGYGARSQRFGQSHSPLSASYWTTEIATLVRQTYVPLALVLALCLGAGLVALVAARRRPRPGGWLGEPWLPLAVVVVEGYLALTSSRNDGTAFGLPWLAPLVVLSLAVASRVPWPAARTGLAAALVAVALGNAAMKSGAVGALAEPRDAGVPGLGTLPVTDGRDVLGREAAASGYAVDPTSRLPAFHERWRAWQREAVARIAAEAERTGEPGRGVLAADNLLVTNTSLGLAATLERLPLRVGWLKPEPDTRAEYVRQLEEGEARFALVLDSPPGAVGGLTPARADAAADALGFRLLARLRLPDGRDARLWWRDGG